MAAFLDGCRFNPTAGGTADWTYSSAVPGYQSPASANVVNGRLYKYRAESADLSQWELGEGAYNTGTGVLARTMVLFNSSGTTIKINFSTVPQVAIVALKEDLISIEEANSFTAAQRAQARANISAPLKGYISGLTLAPPGSSSGFNINPGEAADSTASDILVFGALTTKTTSSWAVGNGFGSLDGGTIANSTWYQAYLIKRPDTGVVDVLTSLATGTTQNCTISIASPGVVNVPKHGLQVNAPVVFATTGALPTGLTAGTQYYVKTVVDNDNFTVSTTIGGTAINTSGTQSGFHTVSSLPVLPANYTLFRRIGPLKTNGSAQWLPYTQTGDEFNWTTASADYQTTTLDTTPINIQLGGVPLGTRVLAAVRGIFNNSGAGQTVKLSSADEALTAVDDVTGNRNGEIAVSGLAVAFDVRLRTNNAAMIHAVASVSSSTLRVVSYAFTDDRGRLG